MLHYTLLIFCILSQSDQASTYQIVICMTFSSDANANLFVHERLDNLLPRRILYTFAIHGSFMRNKIERICKCLVERRRTNYLFYQEKLLFNFLK